MPSQKQGRLLSFPGVAVIAGVVVLYAWIASQSPVYGDFTRDYTERLSTGHADLSIRPDPRLLALPDPYDPARNAGISSLDASLFNGRYYAYFGITPFVTLLVPWLILTGHHLPESVAVLLFASGGFVLAAGTILATRRRYFPGRGAFATLAAIMMVGLASPVLLVLRRPAIYELVITCAWFFLSLAIYCAFKAVHSDGRRGWWLFGASLSIGLAVGSRASYALGAPVFLLWAWTFTTRRFSREFRLRQWVVSAVLPLAVVGAALAAFNWVRFGSPLEFGFNYQINELDRTKVAFWGLRNFGFNTEQYLFRPWRLGPYFPFFLGERAGPISTLPHYGRTEFLYGFLATTPLLALVAAAPWILRRSPKLAMLGLLASGISLMNLFALLGLINGSYRYQVDVVPGLLLVLGWTLLVFFGSPILSGRMRAAAMAITAALVAFSCLVTVFSQFALLGVFEGTHPAAYRRLSLAFNQPVFWVQSLIGYRPRIPVVTVAFPSDRFGQVEPILVTGENDLQDFLYLYYTAPGMLQLGFESIGHGGPVSSPIAVDYGRPHVLGIFYGNLVPPEGAPFLRNVSPADAAELRRTLVVWLDGRPVLDGWADFHATKDLFHWGESPDNTAFGSRFTGRIISRTSELMPTAPSPDRGRSAEYGGMRLTIRVSGVPPGSRVPIVSAGYRSQGDLVYLEHTTADLFRVGIIVDGAPPILGSELRLEGSEAHGMEVSLGSLLPEVGSALWPPGLTESRQLQLKRRVLVRIDGRATLQATADLPDAAPSTVGIGINQIGLSGIAPSFGAGLGLERRSSLGEAAAQLDQRDAP